MRRAATHDETRTAPRMAKTLSAAQCRRREPMKTQTIARALTLIAFAAAAGCAFAATELAKEGNYDAISCWSGTSNTIAFSKEYTAESYEIVGTVVSMIPGGLGDRSTFRCVGMNTSTNGRMGGGNVCEVIDPDGDKRLNAFHIEADGKVTREMVTGTGKYEGMTMTNTVAMMPPMKSAKAGTYQACNRQTGTYKLK
jgi:hypothetical protein